MSGQPLVSALSVCGPAVGRAVSYGDIDEIFGGRDEPRNIPQQRIPARMVDTSMDTALTSKENVTMANQAIQNVQAKGTPHPQQLVVAPKTTTVKKTAPGNAPQKPPFVVGKAPVRTNLVNQKPQVTTTATPDNRAEITELKRQIGELSHLLRLHVDSKVTKRDVGTDPIIFDKVTVDAATSTDGGSVCSRCKQQLTTLTPSPAPFSIVEDSPEQETSLCSQLESLAMQYFSDEQLANIAHGGRTGDIVARKPASNTKKHRQQRHHPIPIVETSPPKRRLAAVATTTQSDTISPNFGGNGGMTLTRRRVMTMEQQVSIFGGGSRGSNAESVPFGFSVASQEFMQRHGVYKTSSSRPPPRQPPRHPDDGFPNYYPPQEQDRRQEYYHQRNHYDGSVVRPPPRRHDHQQRQYHDADAYFDDEWD